MEKGDTPGGRIACEAVLDIAIAAELRETLLHALEAGEAVSLDGSDVERVDTAALQVLLAFFQDARSQDIDVHWHEPSEALLRAARLLGLTELLGLSPGRAA